MICGGEVKSTFQYVVVLRDGLGGRLNLSVVCHLLCLHATSVVTTTVGARGGRCGPWASLNVTGTPCVCDLSEATGCTSVFLESHYSGDEQSQLSEYQSLECEESDDSQKDWQYSNDFDGQESQDGQHLLLEFSTACGQHDKN